MRAVQYQTKAHAVGRQRNQYIKMQTLHQGVQKGKAKFCTKTGAVTSSTFISKNTDDHICISKGALSSWWRSASQQQSGAAASTLSAKDATRSCPYIQQVRHSLHHAHTYTSFKQVLLHTCLGRDYKMLAITHPAYCLPHFEFMSHAALSSLTAC